MLRIDFPISKVTLYSLLLSLLLASGLWAWAAQERDGCWRYLAGDKKAPATVEVETGTRSIVLPCRDWLPRQSDAVQTVCLLELFLIVLFAGNALQDLRENLARRRQRQMQEGRAPGRILSRGDNLRERLEIAAFTGRSMAGRIVAPAQFRDRRFWQSMGKLLRSYLFWTYERGSFHYDVMVTLILLFLFVSPRLIDYKDKPVETVALHGSEVLVKEAGRDGARGRFMFEIRADQQGGPQAGQSETERNAAILRLVEPISGEVTLEKTEPVLDAHGKVIAYNAWVER